jgi:biopolymer transport protein ExbD
MPKLQAATSPAAARGGRGRRVATSLAEINVVPLVDVMLVLLIIFMVTAPMIQRGVDVTLPASKRAPQIASERVEITVPLNYGRTHVVYVGNEPVNTAVLEERVRQKMENTAQKDVFLRGDTGVNLGQVMEVTDILKAAGVRNVGLETRQPSER